MKTRSGNLVPLALAFAALVLNASVIQQAKADAWITNSPMSIQRTWHTATLLTNGQVLVAGGFSGSILLASAELFNPLTGTWTNTGSMNTARGSHTSTLLGNGKVLVAGGSSSVTNSAELYDPATGTWTNTGAMLIPRYSHTATLLLNGKVLVAGGDNITNLSSAELYDPVTGTWASTSSMITNHVEHTATLLPNGKVLVAGGNGARDKAELYNPATGKWAYTGSMTTGRGDHTATLLPNGKVLVAGGIMLFGHPSNAELYDSDTGLWTVTGALNAERKYHTAVLLPDGRVLIAGGEATINLGGGGFTSHTTNGAELYDPVTTNWTTTTSMNAAREQSKAILLADGKVLVVGGTGGSLFPLLSSTESYTSSNAPVTTISSINPSKLPDGGFQLVFASDPNGTNTILTTTNLALPSNDWTALGIAGEFAPGLFVFTAPQATNSPQRFYRVRSP